MRSETRAHEALEDGPPTPGLRRPAQWARFTKKAGAGVWSWPVTVTSPHDHREPQSGPRRRAGAGPALWAVLGAQESKSSFSALRPNFNREAPLWSLGRGAGGMQAGRVEGRVRRETGAPRQLRRADGSRPPPLPWGRRPGGGRVNRGIWSPSMERRVAEPWQMQPQL